MSESNQNHRTRVKICGLTLLEHARFVSGAMADFCGFIFYPKSPRYIKPEEAGAIISWLEGPKSVGVFVNEAIDEVNNSALIAGVHYVQLHGDESPEYCQLMEKEVIKAFRIKQGMGKSDIEALIKPYQDCVSYFLFDTYTDEAFGGTGKTFDWSVLNELETTVPFFVAGGIGIDNLNDVINACNPFAVDVSSSLESEPGIKDFDKMADFFDVVDELWQTQDHE
ncbi:phosphoribosylanthranilate isomerase [bacterium]|nr:MAG: phosphoribosylanthranilate isomerase [bacterium]